MNKTLKLILSDRSFKTKVLILSEKIGMDSALYMMIGEYQSKTGDQDDDFFLEDEPIEAIINKYPELEF